MGCGIARPLSIDTPALWSTTIQSSIELGANALRPATGDYSHATPPRSEVLAPAPESAVHRRSGLLRYPHTFVQTVGSSTMMASRASGARSAPFSHSRAPTGEIWKRAEAALSRSGSKTGPHNGLVRSAIPSMPSEKRRKSRHPPSALASSIWSMPEYYSSGAILFNGRCSRARLQSITRSSLCSRYHSMRSMSARRGNVPATRLPGRDGGAHTVNAPWQGMATICNHSIKLGHSAGRTRR